MFNPWLSFGLRAWQIGLEAQSVIGLRMLRLAAGGARAEAESSRMVTALARKGTVHQRSIPNVI